MLVDVFVVCIVNRIVRNKNNAPCICARFCISNVIAFGHTFFDILLHATAYIRLHIQIRHSKPDPSWRRYAEEVMKLADRKSKSPDSDGQSEGAQTQKQQQRRQLFFQIFNGDWRNHSPEGLIHHCHMQCPCKGMSQKDLGELAANLYVENILSARPQIPALSRWLRCADTCCWYLSLAFA